MECFIWGTGSVAARFARQMLSDKAIVHGFIESNPQEQTTYLLGKDIVAPIYKPDILKSHVYDYLIVAVAAYDEILTACNDMGIPREKIICVENNYDLLRLKYDSVSAATIALSNIREVKSGESVISNIKTSANTPNGITEYEMRFLKLDYFRYKTLELNAQLIINNIDAGGVMGSIAEAGVYRGAFASILNELFPERKLYLFDSFDSFNDIEFTREIAETDTNAKQLYDAFKQTSEQVVMAKMNYPKNVIIRKGYFPSTTKGLEDERYAFVSLDFDLHDSIYDGLVYFYERLNEGGMIFVHDYCYPTFKVSDAVNLYEKNFHKVKKLVLADNCGTLVIVK